MKLSQENKELSKRNEDLHKKLSDLKSNGSSQQIKLKRPERPTVEPELTDNDWAYFKDRWERYKIDSGISPTNTSLIISELRATCSQEVDKILFDLYTQEELKKMNEKELLDCIRRVAVNEIHREVHMQTFFRMKQQDGEPINKFVARLKAQASHCEFQIECSSADCSHKTNSFADRMVAHQLVNGLQDRESQSKLLAEADTLNTLELKINKLLVLESVAQSTPYLGTPPASTAKVAAQRSSAYKKNKQASSRSQQQSTSASHPQECPQKPFDSRRFCQGCGQTRHQGKPILKRVECPAWGKICNHCKGPNHFEAACRSKPARTAAAPTSMEPSTTGAEEPSRSMVTVAGEGSPVFRPGLEGGAFL